MPFVAEMTMEPSYVAQNPLVVQAAVTGQRTELVVDLMQEGSDGMLSFPPRHPVPVHTKAVCMEPGVKGFGSRNSVVEYTGYEKPEYDGFELGYKADAGCSSLGSAEPGAWLEEAVVEDMTVMEIAPAEKDRLEMDPVEDGYKDEIDSEL